VSVRVVIADDHPPTRAGVRAALERAGFDICGEAATAQGAIELALRERPDVCLLDIHMPGGGIAAAAAISAALPATAVVALTVSQDDEDLFGAIKAGARGYLLKTTDPVRLPYALTGVLAGEAALPRQLVARLLAEFRGRSGRRLHLRGRNGVDLTSREWQVLEHLKEGLTTKEIGQRLFISPATVRTHIASILHKMDVPSRAAAVQLLDPKVGADDANGAGESPAGSG
jgi:DNA-binding NarL/FixJ family response regulator